MRSRIIRISILICLSIFINRQICAQDDLEEFPEERFMFIEAFTIYLKASANEKALEVADKFHQLWLDAAFDEEQEGAFMKIANEILKRKLKRFPHMTNYAEAYINFYHTGFEADRFTEWQHVMSQVFQTTGRSKNEVLEEMIGLSKTFFKNYTFFTSQARSWRVEPTGFRFIMDSVPYIRFDETKLVAYTEGDSVVINDTKGIYYPLDHRWEGDKGSVNWEKAGHEPQDVYCTFGKYTIKTSRSEYSIEDVTLYYKSLLDKPVKGKLNDKLRRNVSEGLNNYPQFASYENNITCNRLAEGVIYKGGISLQGDKIISNGVEEAPSELLFMEKDTVFIRCKSRRFVIREEENIEGAMVYTVIYIGKDSIVHPGAIVNLTIFNGNLQILRGQQGIAAAKFYDSYHMVDFDAERIEWNKKTPKIIKIDNISEGDKTVMFESVDYFDNERFFMWQATSDFNPIAKIKMYVEKVRSKNIYAPKLAQYMNPNYRVEQIQRLLYQLVEYGFIFYDDQTDIITVRNKVFKYVLSHAHAIAHVGKFDFDIIQLTSILGKASTGADGEKIRNAYINTDNLEMDIQGIYEAHMSDSQNVYLYPYHGTTVTMRKNRDFGFSGIVGAGYLAFHGNGFEFKYDDFLVDMPFVDSFRIYFPTGTYDRSGKGSGGEVIDSVRTLIEEMNGILKIDAPNNKSGLEKKDYPQYPILQSLDYSYAYYDKRSKYKNVYKRDEFYFKLDPFEFDSLNNFDPKGLRFDGTLSSANIFPDFKETIKLMPDLSLGFVTTTPPEGYPAYGGKGTYMDTINLSNQGFKGGGRVKYLASTNLSSDIVFFPDSMISHSKSFKVEEGIFEGTDFPDVTGFNVFTLWKPYKDSMHVKSVSNLFSIYNGAGSMKGRLTITPTGLYGNGRIDLLEASMNSETFTLKSKSFNSGRMDLSMKSSDPRYLALDAKDLRGTVDMESKWGKYEMNDKMKAVDLPHNFYRTSLDIITWHMDDKKVDLTSNKVRNQRYFASTNKNQDGLSFKGETATLALDSSLFTVNGLTYIPVADVQIFPKEGTVDIKPFADMQKLEGANIKGDTIKFYHNIYEANAKIKGKYHFNGGGNYDFTNKAKTTYTLTFHDLRTEINKEFPKEDKVFETHGTAKVEEEENFELGPKIGFKGNVHLYSPEQFMTFEGYAKIYQEHPKVTTGWFSFADHIDPDSLSITIKEPKNEENIPLFSGIHMDRANGYNLYMSFINNKRSRPDPTVFSAEGLLEQNTLTGDILIGEIKKVRDGSLAGNKYIFNEKTGLVHGEGKIDLNMKTDLFKIESAGNVSHNIDKESFEFNLILAFDFPLPKEAMEIMYNDIYELTIDRPDIDYDRPSFATAVAEFLPDKKTMKMMMDIEETGEFKLPTELERTLLFTDLEMRWDTVEHAFYATSSMGLGYVGSELINKYLVGYLEMGKKTGGDFINLYFQVDGSDEYYFFSYDHRRKLLEIYGTNPDFQEMIESIPGSQRKIKSEDGYFIQIAPTNRRKAEDFVDKMIELEEFLDTR